jgi:hypothetical protein
MHADEAHDVARVGGWALHIRRRSSPAGVSCPLVTSSSSDSRVAVDRGHKKGSSTRIGGAMEDKDGEQERWREQKEREQIRSGEARTWEEGERCGGRMLMAKVRNLAPAPPVICRI